MHSFWTTLMPYTVIGITGEIGSGKGTFATFLHDELLIAGFKAERQTFSNILRETLAIWDIPDTRENLQRLPQVMQTGFGAGALSRAMRSRIERSTTDFVILDGVRWETDVKLLRSFPQSFLIYVTAPADLRFARRKAAAGKTGEAEMDRARFDREAQAQSELAIATIGAKADVRIDNTGTPKELRSHALQFAEQHIFPAHH